jgi:streptogramin lyase
MRHADMKRASAAVALTLSVCAVAGALTVARGATLPGLADLSGTVAAAKTLGQLTVYAFNTDRSVGYMVYVVDGRYRAVDLFPGHYQISVRGTSGQLNMDLPVESQELTLKPGERAHADFALKATRVPPTYIGGLPYPNTTIAPYDVVYPPGEGRATIERICFGCHTSQLYPYNVVREYPGGRPPHDRDGWAITVDRMAHGHAFNTPGKPSYFDGALLSAHDEQVLVDYLAANFGPESVPRSVQQETEPKLDPAALAKAEFIEYRFLNQPGENRFTHTIDFDPNNGNVFVMDRGAASIVEVNPQTGDRKDHIGQGGGEYLQVDVDGTVWFGGLRHLDPKTGLYDTYKLDNGRPLPVSSMVFDSAGDLWLSELASGGLAKWDRKTNSVSWWDVPILRSRPYGITVDHHDMVWFAQYHDSAIARFDSATREFRNYPITRDTPTNIRRTNADSKGFMWAATWGRPQLARGGSLFRVDPATGESVEHPLGIPYTNPYDSDVDDADNVWVATDNHVVKFDQKTNRFTLYPVPERTDLPKLSITREGAIWFSPRNAGQSGGYGGSASVLYPDKDHIKTLAAYYSPSSERNHQAHYHGPVLRVTGATIVSPAAPQNPDDYAAMLSRLGIAPVDSGSGGASRVLKGGASAE